MSVIWCVEDDPSIREIEVYVLNTTGIEGQIDFANILAMLYAVGYTGSVTMEIKSVYDYQVYSASRAVLNSLNLN